MEERYFVHETAIVDPGAMIGVGTAIWHFSHIMSEVVIGSDCRLGQNVFVANGVRIGNEVKIQNNVSVYEGVILEDETFCGPSMVFTNVRTPRSGTPRNTREWYLDTVVRKGASIGANATVLAGIEIGRYALVGAGAVVTRSVQPHAIVTGIPARLSGWACYCGGALRRGDELLSCPECARLYSRSSDALEERVR